MNGGGRTKAIICIGIVIATLVAYEPIRHNDFVNYDDYTYIVKNPQVTSGITWESVGHAFTEPHFYMWHPLTTLSHMLDFEIFGPNAMGHHLVSLVLHIANAVLLLLILANMTKAIWPSAFVAAVFALHPLQVESVAWAAERKTVLSGLFWLLTMAVYIWYTKKPGIGRYILVFGTYVLCIMTKPVVVTLPFVLLLLDYWPLERIGGQRTEKGGRQKASLGRLIIEKIPLLVLSGILGVMTVIYQQGGEVVVSLEKLPLGRRVANMIVSYVRYIGKMIWPSKLAVFYPHPRAGFLNTTVIVCMLTFVVLWIYSIYTGRRRRYMITGWLWYIGTLVPVIGLVQSGLQAMANRYMYIPMLGLLMVVTWRVKELVNNRPRLRLITAISASVLLLSAVILTRIQVGHWQSSKTLFEYALKGTKNNEGAEYCYGRALYGEGQFSEAESHFRNAVRIRPDYFEAYFNLGRTLLMQGKLGEAADCFKEILRHRQNIDEVYYCLAETLSGQKKYEEAINNYARVIKLNPKHPDAHGRMGAVLLMTGRPKEAVAHLNEALQTSRDLMEVYVNLAMAYNQSGDYERAIQSRSKAMELNTDKPETLNNLAWLLATSPAISGDEAKKAIAYAERAYELAENKSPDFLDTLAAAYAAAGRFDDAITTSELAVNLAKTIGQKDLADEVQNRTALYRAGRRYIQEQKPEDPSALRYEGQAENK